MDSPVKISQRYQREEKNKKKYISQLTQEESCTYSNSATQNLSNLFTFKKKKNLFCAKPPRMREWSPVYTKGQLKKKVPTLKGTTRDYKHTYSIHRW